jgi:hypothetical protein
VATGQVSGPVTGGNVKKGGSGLSGGQVPAFSEEIFHINLT